MRSLTKPVLEYFGLSLRACRTASKNRGGGGGAEPETEPNLAKATNRLGPLRQGGQPRQDGQPRRLRSPRWPTARDLFQEWPTLSRR